MGPHDEAVSRGLSDLFHYDGGNLSVYASMVRALDAAVGQVLQTLDKAGQGDDTIVIFTSDNGGERFSKMWPFSGQKTELLEGGLRVPTLLRYRRDLSSPRVVDQVQISMDWLPTLLAAVGGSVHPDYPSDGHDLWPVLSGRKPSYPRTLFWRYKANAQRALRDGNFKYLKINENEFLFDVVVDPRERANLRHRNSQTFERLRAQWLELDREFLPLSEDVFSHGLSPDIQADHYVPEHKSR